MDGGGGQILMIARLDNVCAKSLFFFLSLDSALYATVIPNNIKSVVHEISLVAILAAMTIGMLVKKYTIKYLIVSVLICLFGIFSYFQSSNTDYMFTLFAVVLMYQIELDEILRVIYRTKFVVFVIVVGLALAGILDRGLFASESPTKGVLLGYVHVNMFAANLGILILLMLAVNRYGLKKRHLIISLISGIIVFKLGRARSAFGLLICTVFLILLLKHKVIRKKFLGASRIFVPLIIITNFILILMYCWDGTRGLVGKIDSLFNGRLFLAYMNFSYYPVTLWGQKVDISKIAANNRYYALDNGYSYLLINYGLVGLLIFCLFLHYALASCRESEDYVLGIIVLILMVWAIYEGMMISVSSNFTLIFCLSKLIDYQLVLHRKAV